MLGSVLDMIDDDEHDTQEPIFTLEIIQRKRASVSTMLSLHIE
jgi:hypothetical protein